MGEEEEKTALITIGETPPVPSAWDFDALEDNTQYEEKGEVTEKEGAEFYLTGAGGECGVLIFPDYWGYKSGRIREIADHLSQSCNCMVAIPKLLSEPPLEGGTDGDGLPPGYDPKGKPADLKRWLMLYLWETFEAKIKTVAQHLRQAGVKRIGGVGLGFGAWICCYTTVLCKDMTGAVLVHPMADEIEEMNGGDTYVMASRVMCPMLFMPVGTCSSTYKPGGDIFDQVKAKHDTSDYEPFLNMTENFLARGDASDPGVKKAIVEGVMACQKYLRHRIWPLPIGADSDTLRQACQDGDADMVQELIDLQVPVFGKDAYDVCGMSPIHYAARFGNVQPIKLLVAAMADVNAAGGALNETPLHCCAMQGRNKGAATLLQLKAEVEARDKGLFTALHHAAHKGHLGVCKVLLSGNADLEGVDTAGQTPLHHAAWKAGNEIVRYFIAIKCEIDTEDNRGQTAYDRALQAGAAECSDQLDFEREKREEAEFQMAVEEAAKSGKDKPDREATRRRSTTKGVA